MKYFDTHAHLNISPLLEKVDQIIDECVKHQILVNNVGVNIETSKLAIFQAKKYKNVFATVGIHPTEVDKTDINKTMQEIEKMLIKKKENKIIAIGETGFDLHYNKNNFDIQKAFFEKHLELAVKHKLPLILHIRDAFEQSIDILKKIPNKINVLIHCFDSTKENARQYNNMNFYVAFGGKITHNSKSYLLDAINEINSERILLETDSP
jgi:TatD DNase family protein